MSWPHGLKACRRCGREPHEASYRSRGLCAYCWKELTPGERSQFTELKRGMRVQRDGWPDGIVECKRCHTPKDKVSYLGRGLCSRCVRELRASGQLDIWPVVRCVSTSRSRRERAAQAVQAPRLNLARWVAQAVGLARLAALVELDVEEVRAWASGDYKDVPKPYRTLLEGEKKRVLYLTRQARSRDRADGVRV